MKHQSFVENLQQLEHELIELNIAVKSLESTLIEAHEARQLPMNGEMTQKLDKIKSIIYNHYKSIFI